jgi:predicted NBD/HSP70 family sugar kinase
MKSYMQDVKDIKFLSVCIIVPGFYERSTDTISYSTDGEIESVKIRDFARRYVGLQVDFVIDHMTAAVRYCAASRRQEGNILYINARRGIDSRLIIKGRVLKKQGSFGALPVSGRGLLSDISDMVRSMCNITGLSEVVIESEKLGIDGNAIDNIIEALGAAYQTKDIPAISISSQKFASGGAALISRDSWLDRLLR